jgi:lipopolysaccharide transport system permease protein
LKPLLGIVIFSLLFGKGLNMAELIAPIPYPIFLFVGLLPWTFFADSLSTASGSLVRNQNFLTKIYFPRLIIPIASIGPVLADFVMAFVVLFGLMVYYGVNPGLGLLMLPVLTLLVMMASLGVGLLAAAICVAHRDFRNVVQYMVQIGFYMTPVIYSANMFSEKHQWLLAINPLTGVIGGFRYYLLGYSAGWSLMWLWVSVAEIVALLLVGVYYFRRVEKTFADII